MVFVGNVTTAHFEHARGLLLDLGCGKVPLFEAYQEHVDDNICVDWERSSHPSPHVDHQFDLNRPIPPPSGGFDTLLVTDVLEHIARPDVLWGEMARLLKPGGKIILGVPFCYWIHDEPHDYYRYTEYRLRLYCEDNGVQVVSLGAAIVLQKAALLQIGYGVRQFLWRLPVLR